MKKIIISFAVALCCCTFVVSSLFAADGRPNIIFVMADDMGFGDPGCNNPDSTIPTPNFDRMARAGMNFTDAHTPCAVCTPTRYGVVTGRYCWRTKLKRGVLNGYSPPLIDKSRPTVASFLANNGYNTAVIGKWHLGLGFVKGEDGKFDYTKQLTECPNDNGFGYSYVIPASLDFAPYVYVENGKVTNPETVLQGGQQFPAFLRQGPRSVDLVMENCLDDLTKKAADYIGNSAKKDKPFFLYFPLTAPHKPVLPHPRFVGKSKLGPYGDFIMQVDWTLGQVLDAVEKAGIRDNTLVIYTSDNGSYMYRYDEDQPDHVTTETVQGYMPKNHKANGNWRGTKADIWEAGHRVPFFVQWPTKVKAGSKCDATICLTDLFATAADIIGKKPAKGAAPDSFSFLPNITGDDKAPKRAEPVIHHSASGTFSVRDGQWKLVLGTGSGGRQNPRGKAFERPYYLFDLEADPGETTNLIEKQPEIAKRLEAACLKIKDRDY